MPIDATTVDQIAGFENRVASVQEDLARDVPEFDEYPNLKQQLDAAHDLMTEAQACLSRAHEIARSIHRGEPDPGPEPVASRPDVS